MLGFDDHSNNLSCSNPVSVCFKKALLILLNERYVSNRNTAISC